MFDADRTQSTYIDARYRIEKVLGEGGFGTVYLAFDEELERYVAIKVPHHDRIKASSDASVYLIEARAVAKLDHPHIVPVIDVGSNAEYSIYIVSKYIEGSTLADKIKRDRPSILASVKMTIKIAEALHYAHERGLVHRDVKPGNILVDTNGTPFVVDFGLALKEENFGEGPRHVGTPAYMSPEQARGEGHRVDRRSDIFSLGVVIYELLTGRKPFEADSPLKLMEQIAKREATPLRDLDSEIPKELERICMKSLSKLASGRYSKAKEMAEDLRHWVENPGNSEAFVEIKSKSVKQVVEPEDVTTTVLANPLLTTSSLPAATSNNQPSSQTQIIKIIPKGLRSFDAYDADFFLELIPGPRDRYGLPDTIRFWKTRLEETDPDNTFPLGLICGPSGCGKSSLVKAGLVPRLADDLVVVYIEATADETETRLLNGLRKRCPELPRTLSLKEALATIRHGHAVPDGKKKVVIILDQFEQWLHARKDVKDADLVEALRQCDGSRLQSIVMVRDDFWLAVSRFLKELEIRPIEGQNSAMVDLFDLDHGRKVLSAFGGAYGKIDELKSDKKKEQKEFVNQAVSGLAEDGKVISVRLALFAEMMKGKPWTPESLREVGGIDGVGVTFLEETFNSTSAPPHHRLHQKAAKKVLKALLPESGTDIKGHMRSYNELLEISGYVHRPQDFDELIEILNSEIRLITPTDPEGKLDADESSPAVDSGTGYYQLAHDYLVPRLRDWLTRNQKTTRKGRAELALADLSGEWNARPQNRLLPSVWQWLQINWLTSGKSWSSPERKLMRRANRYYAQRGLVATLLIAVMSIGGLWMYTSSLVHSIVRAETAQLPEMIAELYPYRFWADPLLRKELAKTSSDPQQRLNASLALLPVDAGQVDYLFARLLTAMPQEFPVIREALQRHKAVLLEKLWSVAASPEKAAEGQRLRAAAALAHFDPESENWLNVRAVVSNDVTNVAPVDLSFWIEEFEPVRTHLFDSLFEIYQDPSRGDVKRSLATDVLAKYSADKPQELTKLILEADQTQFKRIYPNYESSCEQELPVLIAVADQKWPSDATEDSKEKLAKRKANAAVVLLMKNRDEKVWPLLTYIDDPRTRSYLIHRVGMFGANADAIIQRLEIESDVKIQRALLLCLGMYNEDRLPLRRREELLPRLRDLYASANDSGLHAAVGWLLGVWGDNDWLQANIKRWSTDESLRERRLESLRSELSSNAKKDASRWYVDSQGRTMSVIPGPIVFWMGSPETELGREDDETMHKIRIGRTFALAATPVTVEQYREFDPDYEPPSNASRSLDSPVVGINWYKAALFCNWLSEREGIKADERCYEVEKNDEGEDIVVRLKKNHLALAGYRLPTEAEMEYATRAGSVTSRFYGETEELLPQYAWFLTNSQRQLQSAGKLKPNDFGLFDVHGNANTWCQDLFKDYPSEKNDIEVDDGETSSEVTAEARVFRGGSFKDDASLVRSAYRNTILPDQTYNYLGFRVARTVLPLQTAR